MADAWRSRKFGERRISSRAPASGVAWGVEPEVEEGEKGADRRK